MLLNVEVLNFLPTVRCGRLRIWYRTHSTRILYSNCSLVSHFGGPFFYRCVEMCSFVVAEWAAGAWRAMQLLDMVMASSFKLIHSLVHFAGIA